MDASAPGFVFAIAFGAGVAGQVIARHTRVPAIVVLLGFGVLIGPDALGWIDPGALGQGLLQVVTLAVAIILFEGGMGLELRRLRQAARPIQRLVTLGALVTVLGGALAAALLLGFSPGRAILYGALVIVTGPTVIKPILRYTPLRSRPATVLEAEGLLIDPIGAIVAAVALEVLIAGTVESAALGALGLVARLAFGAGAGLGLGLALAFLIRGNRIVPDDLDNLVVLGASLTGYALCEALLSHSGILALIVAGTVVANRAPEHLPRVGEFQELLTLGLIGLLFVLLAADVRIDEVAALGWRGVAVVAVLAFVVRPLGVWLCMLGSEATPRERLFVAWLGPRGVIAAGFASIVASTLDAHALPGGSELRALVFLTIALTVVVLGGGAPLVSSLLGVRAAAREGIVVLGAEEVALLLAQRICRADEHVVFVDTNPEHCRRAEQAGFEVVCADAFAPQTLPGLGLARARCAIALTSSPEIDQRFAEMAREAGVPERFVAPQRAGSPGASASGFEKPLFNVDSDVERWNVRIRHGLVKKVELGFGERTPGSGAADLSRDDFLIVAITASGGWEPMTVGHEPAQGDRAHALVYVGAGERAAATLRELGWTILEDSSPDHDGGEMA